MRLTNSCWLSAPVLVLITAGAMPAAGQVTIDICDTYKVYSENERFYLTSVPFSTSGSSLKGKTAVYEAGRAGPIYTIPRPFDAPLGLGGVFLSNDGRVIISVLGWRANDEVPELKSVNVYRDGALIGDFTVAEVTGCDLRKERCDVVYYNSDEVVDRERSQAWTPAYHKVFKAGVSEEERFLSDYPVFAAAETVFVTDSRKNVHRFSLADGTRLPDQPFQVAYPELRRIARETRTEERPFSCKIQPEFPNLASGRKTADRLASILGLKVTKQRGDDPYRVHRIFFGGDLGRDGRFVLETLNIHGGIDRQKVERFFADARFDTIVIPAPCDAWHFEIEMFEFRDRSASAARRERQEQILEEKRELARRQALDTIDGVYIPKDLGDCFLELDKVLPDIDKAEMRAKPKADDMIDYHFGLGMGLRNRWGLWGGSRLQKYFLDRGVDHPDSMSSVILDYYWDWLHGDKEGWKDWEKTWRERRPSPPPPRRRAR